MTATITIDKNPDLTITPHGFLLWTRTDSDGSDVRCPFSDDAVCGTWCPLLKIEAVTNNSVSVSENEYGTRFVDTRSVPVKNQFQATLMCAPQKTVYRVVPQANYELEVK